MKKTTLLILSYLVSITSFSQDIATARSQGIGSTVTVSGIVTNGDELGIIRYVEDVTGGIAIYDLTTNNYLNGVVRGDKEKSYIISGTGDVLEPEGDVIGIGSGGNYALAAGKVLMTTDMSAEQLAKKAIEVASEICVFTNNNIKTEKI